jgi:hypothetical protein
MLLLINYHRTWGSRRQSRSNQGNLAANQREHLSLDMAPCALERMEVRVWAIDGSGVLGSANLEYLRRTTARTDDEGSFWTGVAGEREIDCLDSVHDCLLSISYFSDRAVERFEMAAARSKQQQVSQDIRRRLLNHLKLKRKI